MPRKTGAFAGDGGIQNTFASMRPRLNAAEDFVAASADFAAAVAASMRPRLNAAEDAMCQQDGHLRLRLQ